MNQDDIILLGEFLDDIIDYNRCDRYENLLKKVHIIVQQATASKEYQELMDNLNNELSDIGKDKKDGKK